MSSKPLKDSIYSVMMKVIHNIYNDRFLKLWKPACLFKRHFFKDLFKNACQRKALLVNVAKYELKFRNELGHFPNQQCDKIDQRFISHFFIIKRGFNE
jgi:hypothetical protein